MAERCPGTPSARITDPFKRPFGGYANGGSEPVTIRRGDRIAQLVFARYEAPMVVESDVLGETTRGSAGFGSTGQ